MTFVPKRSANRGARGALDEDAQRRSREAQAILERVESSDELQVLGEQEDVAGQPEEGQGESAPTRR